MGKTTLERVVYEMVSNEFDACCFIANVREESKKCGLCKLQTTLLEKLLMLKELNVQDVYDGVQMIKDRLHNKKILLVLDDVNELDQLKKLAGENCWFRSGSRVMITTRDKHLLESRGVNEIFEAEVLNDEEALQLFSLKALKKDHLPENYGKLSQAFVDYCNELPLALEVLGSFLFGKSIGDWKSELDQLWMHDLLQEMGRDIVCQECKDPEERSRLWSFEDIDNVLTENMSFVNLKFLELSESLKLIEAPDIIKVPNLESLDLMDCINLPTIHPSIGIHKKLTSLNLQGCKNLMSLPIKFEKECLMDLSLHGCSKITKIPEFGRNMKCLSSLMLGGTAITKLPMSIEHLTALVLLGLSNCKNLVRLPDSIFNLKFIKYIYLDICSKLDRVPENLGNAESLEYLYLS
ncbi:hypothetical protein SO802_024874 [Lithocarpus litseifolius]|uniref:NB-ARC domain-containing protein n=1 Tax=Lithocarpus litseifolius TaxID=425828 RepID=A0AAW2CBK7_9ROSI